MTRLIKHLTLAAFFVTVTASLSAETFLIGSYCSSAGCAPEPTVINSATVYGGHSSTELTGAGASSVPAGSTATYYADPGSIWTPPLPYAPFSYYVSALPGTGPGNFTTTAPPGFYNYYSTFSVPTYYLTNATEDFIGFLDVAADDTTDVWLNGFKLTPEAPLGSDVYCADGVPNCRVHLGLFVYRSELQPINVLAFSVDQTVSYTGLNYDATFNLTPEPAPLLLLGLGLLSIPVVRTRMAR